MSIDPNAQNEARPPEYPVSSIADPDFQPAPTESGRGSAGGVRAAGILAWLLLGAMTVVIFGFQAISRNEAAFMARYAEPDELLERQLPDPDQTSTMSLRLLSRYALGVRELERSMGMGDGSTAASILRQTDDVASSVIDQIRVVALAGELAGDDAALDQIASARDALDEASEEWIATAERIEDEDDRLEAIDFVEQHIGAFEQDLESLQRIYRGEMDQLGPAARVELERRHGWFGKLAMTYRLDSDDPQRRQFAHEGMRTMIVVLGAAGIIGLAMLVGFVLFIVGAVLVGQRKIKPHLREARVYFDRPHSAFLEVMPLFLAGFLAIQAFGSLLVGWTGVPAIMTFLIWLMLLVALWPRVRGMRTDQVRQGLGWHAGSGWMKEVGAGIVGYIAGLPIVLMGIILTIIFMVLHSAMFGEGEQPSHPAIEELATGDFWSLVQLYVLACLWAPIVEETIFRGAFYFHLRQRCHAFVAATIVAFFFAIIHPQGVLAVPALMSLAIVFALLREWRGSIIAPVTAHALNNGFVITLLVLALG